jgi:ABC-type nickel/cobalt efflux system permease component RcnA
MAGIEESLAQFAQSAGPLAVLGVAFLLGLRHAADPDHLAAVSSLIAMDPADGAARAARLGSAWGLGHAITLFVFGLPVLLFRTYLPGTLQHGAEALAGGLIVILALRLLWRWRTGGYSAEPHRHGDLEHRHLHSPASPDHDHEPGAVLGRSGAQAFGIGLVHGIGGSAGMAVLLAAGIPDQGAAVAALVVLAVGTAVSMVLLSSGVGLVLGREPARRRMAGVARALGVLSLAFGAWYMLAAVGAAPGLL